MSNQRTRSGPRNGRQWSDSVWACRLSIAVRSAFVVGLGDPPLVAALNNPLELVARPPFETFRLGFPWFTPLNFGHSPQITQRRR